jgi:hypothetical protein
MPGVIQRSCYAVVLADMILCNAHALKKCSKKTGNCEKVYFAERNVILQQKAEGSWVAVKPSRFDVLGIVS